ncbi:MAG: hypothetical protein ACOVQK_07870, partial [Cyanobium sp.]
QRLTGTIGGLSEIIMSRKANAATLQVLNHFLDKTDKEFRRSTGIPYSGIKQEITLENVDLCYSKEAGPSLQAINIS